MNVRLQLTESGLDCPQNINPNGNLPAIQLASETAVFRFPGEILWHHFLCEQVTLSNDESPSVRQPADCLVIAFVRKNLHQSLGENLRIVLLIVVKNSWVRCAFFGHGFRYMAASLPLGARVQSVCCDVS